MNALSPFDCKIKTSLEAHTHFKRQQRIIRQNDYSLIIAEISAKIKGRQIVGKENMRREFPWNST